ncbi:MAG: ABC transporter permease [Vicinamibacterales bacterium]
MLGDLTPAYGWRSRVLSLLAGGIVWEGIARLAASPFLPSCTATARALADLIRGGTIAASLGASLTNLAIGFSGAAAGGVAIGVAMARARTVELIVEPYLDALMAAPGVIYVPVLFTFFGATRAMQVGSVFFHVVFFVAATTARALHQREGRLTTMAAAFGATEPQVFWRVRWPAARPLVISGLRMGALLAVKGLITGEMFVAFTGLGALVRTHGARFEADKVMAMVLVIVAIAVALTSIIDRVERRSRRMAT